MSQLVSKVRGGHRNLPPNTSQYFASVLLQYTVNFPFSWIHNFYVYKTKNNFEND